MVSHIHAYLVHPGKGLATPPAISGNTLPLKGQLFDMLAAIFAATADARDIEIAFRHQGGVQQNDCRDLVLNYITTPNVTRGRKIADRLQAASDNRSGIGLLFLIYGQHGVKKRLVISRFPADQAILAEVAKKGLNVAFLERVFIRRMSAYKAVMLEHTSLTKGFWTGMATDRQAGQSGENISHYWIEDFLTADFAETPAAATKRLARALKDAVKANTNLIVKEEIAHAASLAAKVFNGKATSIDGFCNHFGFSRDTIDTIKTALNKESLFTKTFQFDAAEFQDKLPYRTVEIENGAILTAKSDEFEKIFDKKDIGNGRVEYSTKGRVSDQRMARR